MSQQVSSLIPPVYRSGLYVGGDMPDLAPMIRRQRLVVEGRCSMQITATDIRTFLSGLSEVCGMETLLAPMTHRSDRYGWAGWIHWESSGAHFYAWDQPIRFFSVDVYTCKTFDPEQVLTYTKRFFAADPIVGREF